MSASCLSFFCCELSSPTSPWGRCPPVCVATNAVCVAPASKPGILGRWVTDDRRQSMQGQKGSARAEWMPESVDLGTRAEQVLRDVFGYPAFRGEQKEIVTHVAGGGDALVLM